MLACLAMQKLQPGHVQQAHVQYNTVWSGRLAQAQALSASGCFQADSGSGQVLAEEALIHGTIFGTILNEQNGQRAGADDRTAFSASATFFPQSCI